MDLCNRALGLRKFDEGMLNQSRRELLLNGLLRDPLRQKNEGVRQKSGSASFFSSPESSGIKGIGEDGKLPEYR